MSKIACVTGSTGQTGSYLCELLLDNGYDVYGLKRRSSSFNTERLDNIYNHPNLKLVYGDLSDYSSLVSFICDAKPELFFNLGAQSHVRVSFDIPEYTMDVTGVGTTRCLEAIRKYSKDTRFLQASSSEMFGACPPPQNELSRFMPCSPYAVAKVSGFYSTINYRHSYNLFACNSICFNHESQRRGETFVTRKITRAATRIKLGLQDKLYLGNLNAARDWGHAKDYANAMYKIITADSPDDFVIATGEMYTVKEFAEKVFSKLDLNWEDYVLIDPKYYRPQEVDALKGDASKIKSKLGWEPSYSFDRLVDEMIEHDLKLAMNEKILLEQK